MASIEAIEAMFDKKVTTLVEKMEGRMTKCETRQDATDKTLGAMQNNLERIEANIDSGSSGSQFVPQYIEVKNLCEFKDRWVNGMTRQHAEELIGKLKERLPESLKGKIGEIACEG